MGFSGAAAMYGSDCGGSKGHTGGLTSACDIGMGCFLEPLRRIDQNAEESVETCPKQKPKVSYIRYLAWFLLLSGL